MKTFLAWIGGIALFAAVCGVGVMSANYGDKRREIERKDRVETTARIDREGYDAAKIGMPPTSCPYDGDKETWMKGWQRGFIENRKEPQ